MVRQPRQYIKSSLKIDLNIDHNSGHEADETLDKLAQFLFSKGFGRLKKEDKRIKEVQRNETETTPNVNDKLNYKDFGNVGLKSILRLLNRNRNEENDEEKLSVIFLDSLILKPTAIAQIIALTAIEQLGKCAFYAISSLSTKLAKHLNFPRVSAVGLKHKCLKEISFEKLQHIQLLNNSLNESQQLRNNIFATPEQCQPKGKSRPKKKKKKIK